ncbi:hypothetical protein J6590_071295 [Homalodisca vitripennis]|nr:hypothetical protein J6590_097649 [Homalodisca vitripennis]KAG8291026.1 hypothetical protein J6590_071295 [Homalodisca vitripennis]
MAALHSTVPRGGILRSAGEVSYRKGCTAFYGSLSKHCRFLKKWVKERRLCTLRSPKKIFFGLLKIAVKNGCPVLYGSLSKHCRFLKKWVKERRFCTLRSPEKNSSVC